MRTTCSSCRVPYVPDAEAIERAKLSSGDLAAATFLKGEGCEVCGKTGYKGRVGIHEILEISPEITSLVMNRGNSADIQAIAERDGMVPLRRDAVLKALAGKTTLEEALRTS
jgi:type II secretory ATPase GspE/PulE/Tfp pilus assembly ATPase PilB-like protein